MDELAKKLQDLSWKEFKDYVAKEDISVLKELELYLSDLYHNTGESDFPDDRFDWIRDTLEKSTVSYTPKVGAKLREGENRTRLPFWLGSMDKVTPDTPDQLEKWFVENKAKSYVMSAKLDGVSCLLVSEKGKISLYTRGDGTVGANISYLLPYFRLPKKLPDIAVRGELIVSKEIYKEKYKEKSIDGRVYRNPRNMVAGLIGAKTARQGLEDINFVTYEIVSDSAPPLEEQLLRLKKLGFLVVEHEIISVLNIAELISLLAKYKKTSEYELDGIIVQSNTPYDRNTSGNPDYAFAFKMLSTDAIHETTVLSVEWNVSKWGQIKPVVIVKPVKLEEGVTMSRATAHNAKYVVENNLGPGSVIRITRSKDVIPYIVEVVSSTEASLPTIPYTWDKNHVNIIAKEGDNIMCVKLIAEFFGKLSIKHVSEATVSKMYKNGLNTLLKIVGASKERLLKVPEFQDKSAERIYTNIRNGLQNIKIPTLLGSCGVLGYGMGRKKIEALFLAIPDLLSIYKKKTVREMKNMIMSVEGFSDLSAEKIVGNLKYADLFVERMRKYATFEVQQRVSDSLKGNKYVMSGFRDKKLEDEIAKRGGKVTTSVSKNTTGLILATKGGKLTGKPLKAQQLGVIIYSKEEFIEKYIK